ncbi:hypothetical protein CWB96_18525 [Pseudoalteromonas citrea]|uniref:Uncharacterized protein n=1 Tax=Pseudoalteromonas citrea TaxID=43655 RepID=A0A5S3XL02_9GAMM|nr:hypothetical protein CWB97_17205 [Pseudoalteromonas citrea]TMP54933.1 hypothetical protein CWB96_18525 [Pseudoalteromonas citrea]
MCNSTPALKHILTLNQVQGDDGFILYVIRTLAKHAFLNHLSPKQKADLVRLKKSTKPALSGQVRCVSKPSNQLTVLAANPFELVV